MNLFEDNEKLKLAKAVLNHTKTVANEYIGKHTKPTLNEDEIYEKVMLEIEENNKVKSTWARALTQTDGNKERLEATYIKLRVAELLQEEKESIASYQEYEKAQRIAKEEEEKKLKEKERIEKERELYNLWQEEQKLINQKERNF